MESKGKVIFIDDEEIVRVAYQAELKEKGYDVTGFDCAEKALSVLHSDWPGIVISDIVMPGMNGLALLEKIREIDSDLPVILMTGHGDIPMAVKAIQEGAYDFLEKPFETTHFLELVSRALEKRDLIMEVRSLRSEIAAQGPARSKLIGKSPAMERLRQMVNSVADCDVDVLILGETGTGKDLVAKTLHQQSKRSRKNFVAINCGAMPETLIESELFGHEAGAFTGATQRRIGKFEHAHGGTIFLDEIESMPLHLQTKLLRVLQERTIERVGSNDPVAVDIRVIAASKVDLKKAYEENKFRKDLYYRLNVVPIQVPSLRNRTEDIPLLFQSFTIESSNRLKLPAPPLTSGLINNLLSRKWEGNIRELKNEAEKFVIGLSMTLPEVDGEEPVSSIQPTPLENHSSFKSLVANYEKSLIEQELALQKGDIKKTMDALHIPKQTLYDKMKIYGLNRKDYAS